MLRLFTEYGDLQEIFIMGGERSRSGQSSAFVKYATVDACERAIAGVNMRGRVRPEDSDPVVVKYAKSALKRDRPDSSPSTDASLPPTTTSTPTTTTHGSSVHPPLCKLFIGGLPCFVDRDDLITIFAPFGHIDSVHLMQGKSKSGQACAFVTYQYPGPAQRAIDTLSARYLVDEDAPPISVRFADSEASPVPPSTPLPSASMAGNKRPRTAALPTGGA